jgi:hypothetical protein
LAQKQVHIPRHFARHPHRKPHRALGSQWLGQVDFSQRSHA